MSKPKLSWIIPIRNEAEALPQLMLEISQTTIGQDFEIICINDASTDKSLNILNKLQKNYPILKIINFKTHQGKWAALEKGFLKAKGEIIITCDSDLQDDPKEASILIQKIEKEGFDLVSGLRVKRIDPLNKKILSALGNFLVSLTFKASFKDINSPFKAYKKEVITLLPKTGSMLRFSLLFAKLLGFKVTEVPITHRKRLYGKSKFGLVKYLRILYDLVLIRLLFTGSNSFKKIN